MQRDLKGWQSAVLWVRAGAAGYLTTRQHQLTTTAAFCVDARLLCNASIAGGQRTAAGVPSFAVGVLPPQHLALCLHVPLCCLPQQHHLQMSAPAWLHSMSGCALQQAAPASAASGPRWTSPLRHTSCTGVGLVCAAAIRPLASATQGERGHLTWLLVARLENAACCSCTACSDSRVPS